MLVRAGLIGWSYPHSTRPLTSSQKADGQTYDAIDDLDDEAVDFIATEVLRVTKPALFHAMAQDAKAASTGGPTCCV